MTATLRMRNKYGVRIDASGKSARTVDGILFDSLSEARRYGELKLLEKAGHLSALVVQPEFALKAPCERPGYDPIARVPIGVYVADFGYIDTKTGARVVEDVKGAKTLPLARWKQKHFTAQTGIPVTEVRRR